MPKFACGCGHVINLSNGTSDEEWMLIPEKVIDGVANRIEVGGPQLTEIFYAEVDKFALSVYRCSNCNRLHLQTGANSFESYAKEGASVPVNSSND